MKSQVCEGKSETSSVVEIIVHMLQHKLKVPMRIILSRSLKLIVLRPTTDISDRAPKHFVMGCICVCEREDA